MMNLPQNEARASVEKLLLLNPEDGVTVELIHHGMGDPSQKCDGFKVIGVCSVDEVMQLLSLKMPFCPNCGEASSFNIAAVRGFLLIQKAT